MRNPVFDKIDSSKNTGKIMPVYPTTYKLSQTAIRQAIENALNMTKGKLEETLPDYLLKEYNLLDLQNSLEQIHFPTDAEHRMQARKRLVFEELLTMQLALLELKGSSEKSKGIVFDKNAKMSDIINTLPFKLTKAQLRVLAEIDSDMESEKTMNRLLQGDVGSGKTVVSIISAYKAVKSGYQVAIMAPTAILATQHMEEFSKILAPLGIKCELLLGATTAKNKKDILERLQNGEINVLIGTHALITENVTFKNLGLVVTDEQHRFGVKQRSVIAGKGKNPDVLVMTATPIPRTLAIMLYGDLDLSVIDEMPPGRKPVKTYAVDESYEQRIVNFMKKNIDEGRQAYVVCPLVEENEELNLKSVEKIYEKYKNEYFKDYSVAFIHGKMKNKEKDEIMQKFKENKINILISTTVIEVGISVSNATLMIIENADRFGLAALHQLRGRVGRGQFQSYCILKSNNKSVTSRERLKIMEKSNSGFDVARKDLELRGPGDFFGIRQSGLPEFKLADLLKDIKVLENAQKAAKELLKEDKYLEKAENTALKKELYAKFGDMLKNLGA